MGGVLERCCGPTAAKPKKEYTDEQMEEALKQLKEMVEGKTDYRDVITEYKFTGIFDAYCKQNFDMKNLPKYLEDEVQGIFSLEFITHIFLGAFVWKYMCFDLAKRTMVGERRKFLREGDNEGYKKVIKKMDELDAELFQCCLFAMKKKVQILESNYQKSVQKHLPTQESQNKLMSQLRSKAFNYYMQLKTNNAIGSSNIKNMGKNEALKVTKEVQSLQLEQLKNFYETIPKAQWAEEYSSLEHMLDDKLFMRTGLDMEYLQMVQGILKMDQDKDMMSMKRDFDIALEKIQKEGMARHTVNS